MKRGPIGFRVSGFLGFRVCGCSQHNPHPSPSTISIGTPAFENISGHGTFGVDPGGVLFTVHAPFSIALFQGACFSTSLPSRRLFGYLFVPEYYVEFD